MRSAGVMGFEVSTIRSFLLITATAVALTLSSNARAGSLFLANLDSTQVPPPISNSPATGVGLFTLNDAQTELSFSVTYQDLIGTITGAHFHDNVVGVRVPSSMRRTSRELPPWVARLRGSAQQPILIRR